MVGKIHNTQVCSQSCGVQDPLQRLVVAAQLEVRPQLRDQPPHRGPAQSQPITDQYCKISANQSLLLGHVTRYQPITA